MQVQTPLKINSSEQLSDLSLVQWPAPAGPQIPQPNRPNGCSDQALHGVVDGCEQPTDHMVASLVQDHLDHDSRPRTPDHPERIDLHEAVIEFDTSSQKLAEVTRNCAHDLG